MTITVPPRALLPYFEVDVRLFNAVVSGEILPDNPDRVMFRFLCPNPSVNFSIGTPDMFDNMTGIAWASSSPSSFIFKYEDWGPTLGQRWNMQTNSPSFTILIFDYAYRPPIRTV